MTVTHSIANDDLKQLASGVDLDGVRTRPATVRRVSGKTFLITLREGRNRQIRRMAGKIGHRVKQLKRIRVANIRLGKLKPGQWRHLNDAEKGVLLADMTPMADRKDLMG